MYLVVTVIDDRHLLTSSFEYICIDTHARKEITPSTVHQLGTHSVLVCGLEGPWVSKALLFSCSYVCFIRIFSFLENKSNSFVWGTLNQHSPAATADRVAQRQKNRDKTPLGSLVLFRSPIFPNTIPPQQLLCGWEMAHTVCERYNSKIYKHLTPHY